MLGSFKNQLFENISKDGLNFYKLRRKQTLQHWNPHAAPGFVLDIL